MWGKTHYHLCRIASDNLFSLALLSFQPTVIFTGRDHLAPDSLASQIEIFKEQQTQMFLGVYALLVLFFFFFFPSHHCFTVAPSVFSIVSMLCCESKLFQKLQRDQQVSKALLGFCEHKQLKQLQQLLVKMCPWFMHFLLPLSNTFLYSL